RFAFDVRIIPDAGEHDGLAVLAREEMRLLFAVLFTPLVEALGWDHATLIREHGLERAASQRVRAFGEERRHLFGRRDVGIVFEFDERAGEAARDIAPLFEAADTVTHGRYDRLCLRSQHGRGGR